MSCSFACPCSFPSPVEALFFSSSAHPLCPLHIAANLSLSFRCRCQRLPSGQSSQHLEYKRRNISICWLYHSILNCSHWANYLSKYIGCILARTKYIYMYWLLNNRTRNMSNDNTLHDCSSAGTKVTSLQLYILPIVNTDYINTNALYVLFIIIHT